MALLIIGVLLWSIMHLFPAVAVEVRKSLIGRMGERPYKMVFGLIMLGALFLIVIGWKAIVPTALYEPFSWGGKASFVLVLIGAVLFGAPYPPNNIKRFLRNPQLTGVILWGVGHLVAAGNSRSVVLFGGLTIWAIIQILLGNRRDGPWQKPEAVPFKRDVGLIIFGAGFFALFLFTHQYLFGVSLLDK